jgi:hypothetical protein
MLESIGDYGIPDKDQKYTNILDPSFVEHYSKNSLTKIVGP